MRPVRASRPAFTLIEAIVALTILAVVAGACLRLRATSLAQARSLHARQELVREAATLFELAIEGRLGPSQRLDPDDPESPTEWTGERGERPYRLLREAVVIANPVHDPGADVATPFPERIALWRYTLTLDEALYQMDWNR